MGHSLKATTNSMRQSEPQAIPALREGKGGWEKHLQENSIITTHSYAKVLVNVDTNAFFLLNVLIKYL